MRTSLHALPHARSPAVRGGPRYPSVSERPPPVIHARPRGMSTSLPFDRRIHLGGKAEGCVGSTVRTDDFTLSSHVAPSLWSGPQDRELTEHGWSCAHRRAHRRRRQRMWQNPLGCATDRHRHDRRSGAAQRLQASNLLLHRMIVVPPVVVSVALQPIEVIAPVSEPCWMVPPASDTALLLVCTKLPKRVCR
jgi:hypothetical protein